MLFAICLTLFCLVQDGSSYFLVTTKGEILEVKDTPRFEGKKCYLTLLNGEKMLLPSNFIDREKTTAYNDKLAKEREEQKKQLAEAKKDATADKDAEEKSIRLRSAYQMPKYSKAENATSGDLSANDNTQGEEIIGEPEVFNRTSTDPIYISQETRTRTTNGYRVDCVLLVNSATGAGSIEVEMIAYFAADEPVSQTQSPVAGRLGFRETAPLTFNLPVTETPSRIEFKISADLSLNE